MLRSVYEMIAEMRLTLKLWLVDVFTYDSFWLKIFDRVTLAACDWLKMTSSPQIYEMFLYWWHCQLPTVCSDTQLCCVSEPYTILKSPIHAFGFVTSILSLRFHLLALTFFLCCFVSFLERALVCRQCTQVFRMILYVYYEQTFEF